MKKKFSTSWNSSKQARKQRKYRYNAPLHIKHKFMTANLDKELRKKYGKRNIPLRKGDEVKVMRGSFKGKKGKIISVNLMKLRVSIEGLQRQKKDGTKVNVSFNPSKLQITELNLDDKERINALNRGKKIYNAVNQKATDVETNMKAEENNKLINKSTEDKHLINKNKEGK